MTDVYVRHHTQATGVKIGEVPFNRDAIDQVIPLLAAYGICIEGDVVDDLYAQFAVSDRGAFFEVIAGSEDDD